MTRRYFAVLAVLFASCGSRPETATVLPETLAGKWKLIAQETQMAEQAPQVLRDLGLRRTTLAHYSGPSDVNVTIYELASSTVAFEARQKWTPVENTVSSYRDACFLVASSPAGRGAGIEFLGEFEKQFHCGAR